MRRAAIGPIIPLVLVELLGGCPQPVVAPARKDVTVVAAPELPRSDGRSRPLRKVLPNGLVVVLQESHSAPVVALQMWVKVGSADEADHERGLAHVHEHMLFKGTARRGIGEIAAAVERAGGDINAWTSYDQTVYHLVLASRFFEQGLDILADAVLASAFEPEAFAAELEVVIDEIRRTRDMPERMLSEQLFATAYRQHPYRHPIIGKVETVQALTREQVLDFYRRWYVPSNMVLVVTGDVDEEQALHAVERLLGGAPALPEGRVPADLAPVTARPVEPPQDGLRTVLQHDDIAEAHLSVAFHIPGLLHDDVPALDLISVLLGEGESSRLGREVKRRQAAATDVFAYAYTPREPGLLVAGAATPPERAEAALRGVLGQLFRLHHEPVTADELARARRILETEVVYQKETVEGAARKLGFYETVAGDLAFEERYYQRLALVTPEEMQGVARRYLQPSNMTLALLLPRSAEVEAPQAGAETTAAKAPSPIPAPGAPPPAGRGATLDQPGLHALVTEVAQAVAARYAPLPLPPAVHGVHRLVLGNGLTLLIQEDHAVPLVAVRAAFLGGQRAEAPTEQGIENLLARLLTRGTSALSGEEIARRFDRMGGSIGGFSGRNSFGLRAQFLASELVPALELFTDCLLDPAFPPEEVERERGLVLEEIRARDDNLANLSFRAFAQLLFGEHPYSFDLLGEEETVSRLEREDLRRHFRQRYAPARLTLAVVGDVQPQQVAQEINRLLGGASAPGEVPPAALPWRRPEVRQMAFRYRERNQAHIVLGFPGTTLNSPDRFPLEVLTSVLAGQGGRLFVELRDKRAMAYSVGAVNLEGIDPCFVAVYMATSPDRLDEAVEGLLGELGRVRAQGVTAEELARAQQSLIGSQAVGLQRVADRAATIAFDELYGLGFDAHRRYPEEIGRVTLEQVRSVASKYLDLERYSLAVVKPEGARMSLEQPEAESP